MKKFFLNILLAGTLSSAVAQEVELSAKAGMNVSNLGKSGYLDKIGYHVGMATEFITTPFFSIQTELMYSLQGAAIDYTQRIFLNYHYLDVPVFAKVYFLEDASFDLGMQYGFLLSAIQKYDFGKENMTESVNRHDFSVVLGFTYRIKDNYYAGLRYNIGITNTQQNNLNYENRITNRVLMISAGIIF